jgi:zinc-ribbon domain
LSYPELYSDERVVLQTQNVKVKSVSFEIVLTTRRLVLIDTKKNSIPPQEINLATLKDVESGENAIRDPTITISIITISGNTRQMVLTFSKTSGGERRRECEDWVRALRQSITTTVYHPVTQPATPRETQPEPSPQPPAPAPRRIDTASNLPPKKRIEVARPMKKIVESVPVMPVPVETTSLPVGSFCNRCGNRVPPESAFCNRCGTPVIHDTGTGYLPPEGIPVPPQQPVPAVQQVAFPPTQAPGMAADKRDRPIEDVIHSIEPLIQDSVPRTAPAPLVPAKQVPYGPAGEPAAQIPQSTSTESPAAAGQPGEVQWPVLAKSGMADVPSQPAAPVSPPAPELQPPAPPRKISVWMIAVLALAVLAVIAGAYMFMHTQPGTPAVTPTPTVTVTATTVQQTTVPSVTTTVIPTTTPQQATTPTVLVPTSGVWVKVTYSGTFFGGVGTPGRQRDVEDTGDHFYQIPTTEGPVIVSIRKSDGTSAKLAIDVYKDGALMKHAETTAPRGLIDFQTAPFKTATTATTASP